FDDLVAKADALVAQPFDLALDVLDEKVDAVPPAGAGLAPVGHRPAGGALRAAQEQPKVAPDDVGERRCLGRQEREAEVANVEVDRLGDVVDHVADVDDLFVHERTSVGMWTVESRKPMRVPSSAAVRSKAG